MKPAAYVGTMLIGAFTSAATVVVALVLERVTGYSLHSFTVWFIVPLGALITGALAVSGFRFGAQWLSLYPGRWFLVVPLLAAAATWFGIYLGAYLTFTFEDGTALRDVVSFTTYVKVMITQSQHSFVTAHGSASGISYGTWGYVHAAIQVLGVLGGAALFADLPERPAPAPAPAPSAV